MKKQTRKDKLNDICADIETRMPINDETTGNRSLTTKSFVRYDFAKDYFFEDFIVCIQIIKDRQNADEDA